MENKDRPGRKIYIPSSKTGKMLEYTEEDLRQYRDCIKAKARVPQIVTAVASAAAALFAPIQNKANVAWQRFAIGLVCFFSGQIYSDLHAASLCHPVIQMIESQIEKRTENEESGYVNTSDSHVEKPSDISPLDYSNNMDPPGNFSVDSPIKLGKIDNEAEPSFMTYEELRKRNRENQIRQRYAGNTRLYDESDTRNDGNMSGTDSSSGFRKTNIYGDVLE